MSTIGAVADALETTLENISGLKVFSEAEDIATPPCAIINHSSTEFDESMQRGLDLINFEVFIVVQRSNLRTALDNLQEYTTGSGSKSLRQVIFNNSTLGLSDTTARAVRIGSADNVNLNGVDCLGATMEVQVYTKGSA